MSFLQAIVEKIFEHLKSCGTISFMMTIGDGSELGCLQVIVSYGFDNAEEKNSLSVKHGLLLRKKVYSMYCPVR